MTFAITISASLCFCFQADSLVLEGVEEAPAILAASERLEEKWREVEDEAAKRKEDLEKAMEEAKECDAKVVMVPDLKE